MEAQNFRNVDGNKIHSILEENSSNILEFLDKMRSKTEFTNEEKLVFMILLASSKNSCKILFEVFMDEFGNLGNNKETTCLESGIKYGNGKEKEGVPYLSEQIFEKNKTCQGLNYCHDIIGDIGRGSDKTIEILVDINNRIYKLQFFDVPLGIYNYVSREINGYNRKLLFLIGFDETEKQRNRVAEIEKKIKDRENEENEIRNLITKRQAELLRNITHEFRTPLTTIIYYCDEILSNLDGNCIDNIKNLISLVDKIDSDLKPIYNKNSSLKNVENYLAKIKGRLKEDFSTNLGKIHSDIEMTLHAARSFLRMIDNLLTLQVGENVKYEICNVNSLINEIIKKLNKEIKNKNLEVRINAPKKLIVKLDIEKVQKIIEELIINSIKFNNKGGKIDININLDSGKLKISVSDSGVGISRKFLECGLFKMLSQEEHSEKRENSGIGAGLYQIKQCLNMMGGSINCSSEKGGGTTFAIDVPIEEAEKIKIIIISSSNNDLMARITESQQENYNCEIFKFETIPTQEYLNNADIIYVYGNKENLGKLVEQSSTRAKIFVSGMIFSEDDKASYGNKVEKISIKSLLEELERLSK